jgi:choline dehydrogenase-like flavoprotein
VAGKVFFPCWPSIKDCLLIIRPLLQRGKVLGGSTSTNGLFYCRGHAEEYDAWDALNPGGNVSWGWTAMSTYMDKAETYHPPTADQIASTGLKPDASAHGSTGPIQVRPTLSFDIGFFCSAW